jgi:hypothetical protein
MKFTRWPILLIIAVLAAACSTGEPETVESGPSPSEAQPASSGINYDELEIITLLPRDGIPAIDNPKFLTVAEADSEYGPDELVMGVEFNGEARAYSVPLLSSHEIVNDTVGGVKISVTW